MTETVHEKNKLVYGTPNVSRKVAAPQRRSLGQLEHELRNPCKGRPMPLTRLWHKRTD
jgi:hypothetical protein